ncbi:prephenate dehydrogenase/arogenate dehydrogenase family protein [Nitriliruptoraceae bacterium ZYF776]|nr:prephenate dehydrogenase/arogenate dehydrogenase family protein [Profundirhabdus halotolerans]
MRPVADPHLHRPGGRRAAPRLPARRTTAAHGPAGVSAVPAPARPDGATVFDRVAVVGGGLVGGSVAAAARAAGCAEVVLTDADPQVRARAASLGLAHRVGDDVADTVATAELVVVAVPSAVVPEVAVEVARAAPPTAVLTDVASLKGHLVPAVEAALADHGPQRYVGGHPMAGSERSGPDAADARLFQAATWVVTPTGRTDDAALTRLSGFLAGLGARVLALPPERHDELVAVVSHLPQLVASTLADVAAEAAATTGEALLAVAGGGFRDTTRIAASDPELWVGILRGNRDAVLEAVGALETRVGELRAALAAGEWDTVQALLARASAARRQLVSKVVPTRAVDLVVPLADRPGALATTTTVLGEAGINVEDLAMRHAADGTRGALLIRVDAAAADRAVAALAAAGTTVHVEHDVDQADLP